MDQPKHNRLGVLAALLSIIPGLGQIYAGYLKRGLALFLVFCIQVGLLLAVQIYGLIAWLALLWLWNIRDAERLASGRSSSITIPVLILLLVNFAAGWKITQVNLIDLEQGLAGNDARQIVLGLLQPNLISPSRTIQTADTKYYVGQPAPPEKQVAVRSPRVVINHRELTEGAHAAVNGYGFSPNREGMLYLLGGAEIPLEPIETDSRGKFSVEFRNPHNVPGDYWIEARVAVPSGGWEASETLVLTYKRMLETVFMALMGTVLSVLITIPLSFLGARNLTSQIPLGSAVYSATRTFFNVLRSVEVIIIAIIMAVIVGIGPFAGVLALAIHGIGALGKLYSEAIESIDPGPMEAVTSTGASSLQVVMFGVVPQIVPQFVAFTIYRWDINVRMATVIGLVGGGGIGFLLKQYIDLTQWHQAGTAIWLIAAVVMVMDFASAVIREKII